jgi:hypothetical protein
MDKTEQIYNEIGELMTSLRVEMASFEVAFKDFHKTLLLGIAETEEGRTLLANLYINEKTK